MGADETLEAKLQVSSQRRLPVRPLLPLNGHPKAVTWHGRRRELEAMLQARNLHQICIQKPPGCSAPGCVLLSCRLLQIITYRQRWRQRAADTTAAVDRLF